MWIHCLLILQSSRYCEMWIIFSSFIGMKTLNSLTYLIFNLFLEPLNLRLLIFVQKFIHMYLEKSLMKVIMYRCLMINDCLTWPNMLNGPTREASLLYIFPVVIDVLYYTGNLHMQCLHKSPVEEVSWA